MTRGELVVELAAMLGAGHEARFIVDEVLGRPGSSNGPPVGTPDVETIRALARRRSTGEPLQYVLGHWAFRSLDLVVDPRVLIPRPETEQVVEVALREVVHLGVPDPVIVDAGTGSGRHRAVPGHRIGRCVAEGSPLGHRLQHRRPGRGHGEPREGPPPRRPGAHSPGHAPRDAHGRQCGPGARMLPVTLVEGSWLTALPTDLKGGVTLVVSNPPYVATSEWAVLPPDVRREPPGALVAGAGSDGTPGLGDVEEVLGQAARWLSRPGAVVIELAPHQADAGIAMARAMGYADVCVRADLARRPRALVGLVR